MKLSVLQQDLLPPLSAVSRSVGVKSTLPVLDNIFLSAQDKKIKIAGTNLEIGVIKQIPADILEEGEITVPAKTIVELISGIGSSKVELESRGDVLEITSGKFKATVNGISASEFPAIPLPGSEGIVFKKDVLVSCSQILFSAAVDEGRPVLTGILTHASKDKLDLVATDGFRLAHRQVSLPENTKEFKSLIPKKTFEEVLRVISEEAAEQISIATSVNQNQIIFSIGQTIVSSRLIEGQFPSWEKIIPTQLITRAVVDKDQILKAVKLASVFARSEANIIVFKVSEGKLVLESSAKELGSQQNEVEGQIEGEDLQVAFNAKFLQDAVAASPTSQVMIELSGQLSAALIKPIGEQGLQYIIMPVRLS
ncbi:DNA polymerase III subunit beta [Candidatus Daviesbacteria bacterium]|nr:DNA polymerase III subunit beta [Candidatus Daviesbacteria bacterium]